MISGAAIGYCGGNTMRKWYMPARDRDQQLWTISEQLTALEFAAFYTSHSTMPVEQILLYSPINYDPDEAVYGPTSKGPATKSFSPFASLASSAASCIILLTAVDRIFSLDLGLLLGDAILLASLAFTLRRGQSQWVANETCPHF
jgi:hypothetical protein